MGPWPSHCDCRGERLKLLKQLEERKKHVETAKVTQHQKTGEAEAETQVGHTETYSPFFFHFLKKAPDMNKELNLHIKRALPSMKKGHRTMDTKTFAGLGTELGKSRQKSSSIQAELTSHPKGENVC